MDNIIEIKNINKTFNATKVLNNITFSVKKGEIIGLVGLNGAGKSTLISIILNIIKPDYGEIIFNKELSTTIGVMLQEISMPENIKVKELVQMILKFSHPKMNLDELLKISNLTLQSNCYCSKLSGGKQRALQFCLAIANHPDILFVDAPTVGMDFEAKNKFWEYIFNIAKDKTIILTSHDIEEIESISNRILILDKGSIKLDTSTNKLKQSLKYSKYISVSFNELIYNLLKNNKISNVEKYSIEHEILLIYSNNISKTITDLLNNKISIDDIEIKNAGLEIFLKEHLCSVI